MEFLALVVFVVVALIARGVATQAKRAGSARREAGRLPRSGAGRAPTGIRDLLEQLRRSMEEAERKARGEPHDARVVLRGPAPALDEDIEDRETLEITPVAVSRETEPDERAPVYVDYDNEAEALVARRIEWAEVRAQGRRPGDHRAFDARIRQAQSKPAVEPRRRRPAGLRELIIWREVLGPPVGLRDEHW